MVVVKLLSELSSTVSLVAKPLECSRVLNKRPRYSGVSRATGADHSGQLSLALTPFHFSPAPQKDPRIIFNNTENRTQ